MYLIGNNSNLNYKYIKKIPKIEKKIILKVACIYLDLMELMFGNFKHVDGKIQAQN
jgi:hypothetical protein